MKTRFQDFINKNAHLLNPIKFTCIFNTNKWPDCLFNVTLHGKYCNFFVNFEIPS